MVSIPLRPSGFSTNMSQDEQDCLTWYVLSSCKKEDAYVHFINPAMKVSPVTLKSAVKQFFDDSESLRYISAYEECLQSLFRPKEKSKHSPEDIKKRKADAVSKITEYIINQANNIELLENPEDLVKIADKMGLFDSEETQAEAPRRYIPVGCSDCEYKKFIENNCVIE